MHSDRDQPRSTSTMQIMMGLFHKLSLRERIVLITQGLRQPPGSPARRQAFYQIQRLQAYAAAVILPLCILLLGLRTIPDAQTEDDVIATRLAPPPPERTKLKPIDPLPADPLTALSPRFDDFQPSFAPPVRPENPVQHPSAPVAQLPLRPVNRPLPTAVFVGGPTSPGAGWPSGRGPTTATEVAVLRALRWLKAVQESDGAWRLSSGGGPGKGSTPAMTGLALLTFLAHSETTGSEEFGRSVEKALRWLVDNQQDDGRFRERDSHDYSHPIAAYALAEACIVNRTPTIRQAAVRAVDIIIAGQHPDGAWDYNCRQSTRRDTSYMGWCLQALKAAEIAELGNEGLAESLRLARRGFGLNAGPGGAFGYTDTSPSHLTGVGVLCLQLLGAERSGEVRRGLQWLQQATCRWDQPWGRSPIYYWYYVTQAKFHAEGDTWDKWNRQMRPGLTNHQVVMPDPDRPDRELGYWEACAPSEHCRSYVYNTTLCTLMLEVYYRGLRTFRKPGEQDAEFREEKEIEISLQPSGRPKQALRS